MKHHEALEKISFENIRNQNEERVSAMIREVLQEFDNYTPNKIDLEDIYALTLNKLPARYMQEGNFPLEDDVTDDMIRQTLKQSIERVSSAPTLPDEDSLLLEDD